MRLFALTGRQWGIAVFGLVLVFAGASALDLSNSKVRPISAARDHIAGNVDAEVSLIEYSDFECPFCKRFHGTAKQLVEAYGGRVNWVFRHFPLNFHNPAAQREAEASECAAEIGGNGAFWFYADRIYARTPLGGRGVPEGQLAEILGVPVDEIAKYESGAARVGAVLLATASRAVHVVLSSW